ncbi:MAG: ROK family protein [Bacteroidales bacterium]|jgi:polyphosphate glucokinase|nr:ROK family protein [Bacteroidales bacterium]
MKSKFILGIDIGGSGIKGAIVNVKTGEMTTEKYRLPTPDPSTPEAVVGVIRNIAKKLKWNGPIGIGFPGVMQHGIVKTAANIDDGWLDVNLEKLIEKRTDNKCITVNDADAAGMAEMQYGAGKKNKGVVIMLTVGTGIGCSLFTKGKLVPNCEWGHICLPGGIEDAEKWASDAARKKFELSWDEWMLRLKTYIDYIEEMFWPDLVIIGGGLAKKLAKNGIPFESRAKIVPADLFNEAGIIGAAVSAKKLLKKKHK